MGRRYKAHFINEDTLETGESEVGEFFNNGAVHHPDSWLFLCPLCGKVWARVETAGGRWWAQHVNCVRCGPYFSDGGDYNGILYVLHWKQEPNELEFYPEFVLKAIFLHELKYYEVGK